jgi:hypothetical protein
LVVFVLQAEAFVAAGIWWCSFCRLKLLLRLVFGGVRFAG